MAKKLRHVRHHAKKHHQEHSHLKNLLKKGVVSEGILSIFVSTFVIAISTIIIFFNWGRISSFFSGEPELATPELAQEATLKAISGFQSGIVATYQVNGQVATEYVRVVRQIPTNGFETGVNAVNTVGGQQEEIADERNSSFMGSIELVSDLSKGQHLTSQRKNAGLMVQKSILSTFYLGEKTVNIDSSLQSDSRLLSQINNALSVDIFAYLNQSNDRATSLDNYINLLETLQQAAIVRSTELQSQINFLEANFEAQDRSIELTEEAFFRNIQVFDGENAEEELARFIGLEQEQSEVRAKMGAYQGLKDYYDGFLPLIDNLTRSIKANRDPLIAGVKVVEIQNMTLPLIIRER